MDVATPTADCITLIHDLLSPVKANTKHKLSHQEVLALFEQNYFYNLIRSLFSFQCHGCLFY